MKRYPFSANTLSIEVVYFHIETCVPHFGGPVSIPGGLALNTTGPNGKPVRDQVL